MSRAAGSRSSTVVTERFKITAASARLGVTTVVMGRSRSVRTATVALSVNWAPEDATMTGSTTRGMLVFLRISKMPMETARVGSRPILIALTGYESRRRLTWSCTSGVGTGSMWCTMSGVSETTLVTAESPCTPRR